MDLLLCSRKSLPEISPSADRAALAGADNGSSENEDNSTLIYPGCFKPIKTVYSFGWAILRVSDDPERPSVTVVDRATEPIIHFDATEWTLGKKPWPCKQPNIAFVEGAEALGGDRFRLYFGAADATEGTAVASVQLSGRR